MTEKQWRDCLGQLVRDYMRCPELEYYFSIKMNKPRAAVMVKQQSLFVRHRRECWSHVSANCPVMGVKQRILEHEYEEIIRDDYSEYGHLHLIIRQGKSVDVEPEEIINAELKGSPTSLDGYSMGIRQLAATLDEKQRRRFVGLLAADRGRGSVVALARLTGLSRTTILKGRREALESALENTVSWPRAERTVLCETRA